MKIDDRIKGLIKIALEEDIGKGDITTSSLISKNSQVRAVIIAKQSGVVAGLDIAKAVFIELDKKIKFKSLVKDGDKIKSGKKIVELYGSAWAILSAERTALNFLGRLSGIATLTRQFVDKVKPYKVKIMDTRKTAPGLRSLEKYAVKCAGGVNHRIGLWDGILIKDNHLAIHRKMIKETIKLAREKSGNNIKIEVEVENIKQLNNALSAKADIILLDNMTVAEIKNAVRICRGALQYAPTIEVSGGINLANVCLIAKAGVDRISIGALTHSAKAFDFSLDVVFN